MTSRIRMTERQLQKRVTDALTLLNWRYRHETFSIGSEAGFPDLECFHEHHGLLFLELKVGTNQPTAAQREWLEYLHRCGQRVAVIRETEHDHLVLMELLTGEFRHLELCEGVYGLKAQKCP